MIGVGDGNVCGKGYDGGGQGANEGDGEFHRDKLGGFF